MIWIRRKKSRSFLFYFALSLSSPSPPLPSPPTPKVRLEQKSSPLAVVLFSSDQIGPPPRPLPLHPNRLSSAISILPSLRPDPAQIALFLEDTLPKLPSERRTFVTRSPMNPIFQIWSLVALFLAFVLVFLNLDSLSPFGKLAEEDLPKFIYKINVKDIKGNDVSLSAYEGKVLLIVNVASKCGLTHSNYKEMNVLYEKYRDKGFEILAFPCNQFAGQEPGSNVEIEETVCSRFKAEFPIFEKINVNGKNTSPLYKYLKSQKSGFLGSGIKWNFTKFLVGKNGAVVGRYSPNTSPSKIECDIQKLLKAS